MLMNVGFTIAAEWIRRLSVPEWKRWQIFLKLYFFILKEISFRNLQVLQNNFF